MTALATPHGALELPAFLPDATRAAVRTLDSADLIACGVKGLVANAFHLAAKPGAGAIASLGGLHRFMGWDGPILTDSGGFQVYSLLKGNPRLGSVSSKGFSYRPAAGAEKSQLTPEKCIQIQHKLGADVFVCLDHCTHPDARPDEQRASVEHTVRWAQACRTEFDRFLEQTEPPGQRPLLFAVVQGGNDLALRRECIERLTEISFDGYGYGGWPIGDDGRLLDMVQRVGEMLPREAVKWALGVGKPENLVRAAAVGYGLFDCVIPTRDARHKRLYTFNAEPQSLNYERDDFYSCVYLQDDRHRRDERPVDPYCDCLLCRRYARAYLHHLFNVGDAAAQRLATIHNLRFYARLIEALRTTNAGAGQR